MYFLSEVSLLILFFILVGVVPCSEELPNDSEAYENLVPNFIDEAILSSTKSRVIGGRKETQERVRPHLEYMSAYLDNFRDFA